MVFKKSKKNTTHWQFEIMVDYLEKHPELTGFVPGASESSADRRQLWNRLTEILNQHGPPTRSFAEWKSIWSDYKYNVKKKLCTDFKFAKRRHPDKRLLFSNIEGKVINMLKLKEKLCSKQYKLNSKPFPRRGRRKREISWCKKTTIDHGESTTTHDTQEPAVLEEENEESIAICSDFERLNEKCEFVKEKPYSKQYKLNSKPFPRRGRRKREVSWCKETTIDHGESTTTHDTQEPVVLEEENEESIAICSDFESLNEKCEFVNVFEEVNEPLNSDENLLAEQDNTETLKCDMTLMLKDTLHGMQKTQLEMLGELKEYNRQKKDTHRFKEQQLQLEREKFEEQKRQNLEANKRANMELELKRRKLDLYEIKLRGSCTDCVVKTENVEFVSNFH